MVAAFLSLVIKDVHLDKTLLTIYLLQETFRIISKVSDAHEVPLYKVKAINENLIATGDEDGTVKLWDKR